MASLHTLCETFLKRSRQRAATVLAALIATAALAEGDLQAQAQPGHGASAAAAAQTPSPAAPSAAPSAPAAGEAAAQPAQPPAPPVEAPHRTSTPAPAPAAGDHAAPAAPAGAAHGAPSAHGPPAQGEHAAPAGAGHGDSAGGHDEGVMPVLYRLLNFAILAGGLYYFLNKPIGEYFASRGQQIRGGLVSARETSERATAQLAELDRRLQALPAEIEAVRAKGVKEIAAEEARIQAQAEAERKRLIDDVQRDIDVRVRVARKQLAEDAADFSVKLAADRVRSTITEAEQTRLIDRYTAQVKDIHG